MMPQRIIAYHFGDVSNLAMIAGYGIIISNTADEFCYRMNGDGWPKRACKCCIIISPLSVLLVVS